MSEDDELLDVLHDIRRWVKLIGMEDAREKVHEAIEDSDEDKERENKIIFHLTDGSSGARAIAEYVSMSDFTVNSRQSDWAKMGLLEKSGDNDPYRKLITLEEAGIDVPDIPVPEGDD